MCRSRAQGGKRCNAHLIQGVNSTLIQVTVRETGLDPQATTAALADLRTEGANAAEPTRTEVDEFLASQQMRIRHLDGLTDRKRTSLIGRLQDAIGRVLPDRATWHAWRNILGEAWARSRRKVVAGFIAGAISMGAGACAAPTTDTPTPAPTTSISATTEAPGTPATPADRVTAPTVEQTTFEGEAVTQYGQDGVQQAYAAAVAFTSASTFNSNLLPDRDRTAADFAYLEAGMTPTMATDYRATVAGALAGNTDGRDGLNSIVFSGVESDAGHLAASGPWVVNHSITAPKVALQPDGRLQVSLHEHGETRVTYNGQAQRVAVDKDIVYYMTQAPAGSAHTWLVDGITSNWSFQPGVPEATN